MHHCQAAHSRGILLSCLMQLIDISTESYNSILPKRVPHTLGAEAMEVF